MPESPTGLSPELDRLCIDAVKVLAMDAVEKASSGHPGTPMALAPMGYLLWTQHLRHNPADPGWPTGTVSCSRWGMRRCSSTRSFI